MVFSNLFFGIGLKSGMLGILVLMLGGMLSSALLGFAVSAFCISQYQAHLFAAIYLILVLVFSGVLSPLSQSAAAVRFLAIFLPLTPLVSPFQDWMNSGMPLSFHMAEVKNLSSMCVAYTLGAALLFRRRRRFA